jgi:hypothetical protein
MFAFAGGGGNEIRGTETADVCVAVEDDSTTQIKQITMS